MYLIFFEQVFVAYGTALLLHRNQKRRGPVCGIIVAIEILALTFLKGSSFFITNVRYISKFFSHTWAISYLEIAAPLAISYYTLMLVSYVLDVHWGKIEPEKNPLKLLL